MSKEIKFRYYYPNQVKNSSFIYSHEYKEWDDEDGGGSVHLTLVNGIWAVGHDEDSHDWPIDENKLQQFTGLKDKNGKEIYEGDIIEYEDLALDGGGDGEKHIHHIKDLEDAFMFNMAFKYVGKEQIEVIGNIFENPELIN